jgi:hypothetical protein
MVLTGRDSDRVLEDGLFGNRVNLYRGTMLSNSGQKEMIQKEIREGSSIKTSVNVRSILQRISKCVLESFRPVDHLHVQIDCVP